MDEPEAFLTAGFVMQGALADLQRKLVNSEAQVEEVRKQLRELWPHVVKNHQWCVEHAPGDMRAGILLSKLAGCAGNLLEQVVGEKEGQFFIQRSQLIQWREQAMEAITEYLEADRAKGDVRADLIHDLMGHLSYLGFMYVAQGDMARARTTLERAIRDGVRYDNHIAEGAAYMHLAMVSIRERDLGRAEAELRQAVATAEARADRGLMASARDVLSTIASERGDEEKAAAESGAAARLYEELNQKSGLANALANLASTLVNLGRLPEARSELDRAKAIAGELRSPQLRGQCLVTEARLLWALKRPPKQAVALLEAARQAFLLSGDMPQTRKVEAILEQIRSDPDAARELAACS